MRGYEFRAGQDVGGGDHRVETGAASGAGEVEKLSGKGGCLFVEGEDAGGQNGLKSGLVTGMHGFRMEFHPSDRRASEEARSGDHLGRGGVVDVGPFNAVCWSARRRSRPSATAL